jgi:hypothetical protein
MSPWGGCSHQPFKRVPERALLFPHENYSDVSLPEIDVPTLSRKSWVPKQSAFDENSREQQGDKPS